MAARRCAACSAFSRADPEGPSELVDLGALLHDVAKLTAPSWRDAAQLEGRNIALSVETDAEAIVSGWPASLREAFANLVLNAVDAMPEGGAIRLSARRHGTRVDALVEDSGIGMASEVQERAFEPFFTTKGERGTGLGLAVVIGIVERHDGLIAPNRSPARAPPSASPSHSAGPAKRARRRRWTTRRIGRCGCWRWTTSQSCDTWRR